MELKTAMSLRVSNPILYFEELEKLKLGIIEQSSILSYARKSETMERVFDETPNVGKAESDNLLKIPKSPSSSQQSRNHMARITKAMQDGNLSTKSELYHLVECSRLAQGILFNICRLSHAGFITDRISIVVADSKRGDVAKLQAILLERIDELITTFAKALEHAVTETSHAYDQITTVCKSFLTKIDIRRQPALELFLRVI